MKVSEGPFICRRVVQETSVLAGCMRQGLRSWSSRGSGGEEEVARRWRSLALRQGAKQLPCELVGKQGQIRQDICSLSVTPTFRQARASTNQFNPPSARWAPADKMRMVVHHIYF